jgi:3-oxoacyl-[acyl-carrier protein] reductase
MDLGIAGLTAIVTASSRGLGRSSAEALAAEGANVVINGRDPEALERTRSEIADRYPVRVEAVVGDVRSEEVVNALFDAARALGGGADIVVANAGGPPVRRALEVSDQDIQEAVDLNFKSMVRLMRRGVEVARTRGFGRVVGIASSSIVQAIVSLPLSNAARIALWAWVKTAAYELGQEGLDVTINLACPGSHATDRMKELGFSGRMGDPRDFGAVVAFLCSRQARFVNGARIVVDGGSSLAL